jgi:bisphosphoglycerate-dependent phosphoglycerate mutase
VFAELIGHEFSVCAEYRIDDLMSFCRWTIPEVTEALKEAGFQEVHIWMREMSQAQEQQEEDEEVDMNNGVKYEEVDSFQQVDAWNAYVVAVSPQTL